ncbi:thermonuclease family protein, partial [Agrobacterium sp. BETTINA12B]|nr:thermonuclease family protein [Agrobacterium sp. BETTINA12B]
ARRTVPMTPSTQQASPGDSQTPSDDQKQAGGTEPVELVRPSSDRAGMLTVGNRSVQLSGIIPTDIGRMCAGSDGKSWPCGTAARTAFRMYLRGRIIDCDLPSATWQGTMTGHCRYVRIDLSEWLVRFGWAEPEAGSPLEAAAEQAKQQKRGIYGDDPRKGRKSTLAPAPAKEDPLNPI